ncbi:MAG: peroxiredoxin [Actinobacteria bacterium]|nr:peroxiredoxin [Actinomycetota bacterium]
MLKESTKAPDFKLPDKDNKIHSLSDYLGKWVVLYFYPKDDTPGCTKEATNFRDNIDKFKSLSVEVIGISSDTIESHKKFIEKFNLNILLLSDLRKEIIGKYGAKGVVTKRISYLINPEGVIDKVYPKVNPSLHAQEILDDLSAK